MAILDKNFPVIWTAWIIAIVVTFGIFEYYAIVTGGTTLSRYTWEISKAWPLLPFVLGFVCGTLATHFYWHWSPPGSENQG